MQSLKRLSVGCASALLLALPAPLRAHVPDAGVASPALTWSGEPWLLAVLAGVALLYVAGLRNLWRSAGTGRGLSMPRAWAFGGGWLTLLAALVSPLDTLGSELFSAHMVQHELLMIVAAPLLVLGRPLAVWTWSMPRRWRARIAGGLTTGIIAGPWAALTHPVSAWALHALALWLWHAPVLFDAALRTRWIHDLQHASFLSTALLFWWAVLGPGVHRATRPAGLLYLFTTMAHTTALGALLTLAPTSWYAPYVATSVQLGLDPLEDQQLGGLVMWVPGGLVYLLATLALLASLMRRQPAPLHSATRRAVPRDSAA